MTGYLVVLRHGMDDFPVFLASTSIEANRVAKQQGPKPSENIKRIFHLDASTPIGVWIIEFKRGKPVTGWVVKEFDDELGCEIEKAKTKHVLDTVHANVRTKREKKKNEQPES